MSRHTRRDDTPDTKCDLPCRDQAEQAKQRLRDLIADGLTSGSGSRRSEVAEKQLMAIARGEID